MNTEELYRILIAIYAQIEDSFPFSMIVKEIHGDPKAKYEVTTISTYDESRFTCGISQDLELSDDPSYDEASVGRIIAYSSREVNDLYLKL